MLDQLILGLHLVSVHDGSIHHEQCQQMHYVMQGHKPVPDKHYKPVCTSTEETPNNTNPGVYVRHTSGFGIGYVKNSERNDSFHVDWTRNVWKNLDITIGGATGYERANIVPIVAPSLRFKVDKLTTRLVYLPGMKGSRDALHLAVEF